MIAIALLCFLTLCAGVVWLIVNFVRKQPKKKPLILVAASFVLMIAFGIAGADSSSTSKTKDSGKPATAQTESKDSSSKKEDAAKKDSSKETKQKAAPKWNTKEMKASENGNMRIAASLVKEDSNLAAKAENANPAEIIKRPWDYYGKVIRFTGQAAVLQDYPPQSDPEKALGGSACDIVMTVGNSDTIVEGLYLGSSKGITEGQTITAYGYPVGVEDVPNKMGGTFTHLMVVGVIAR